MITCIDVLIKPYLANKHVIRNFLKLSRKSERNVWGVRVSHELHFNVWSFDYYNNELFRGEKHHIVSLLFLKVYFFKNFYKTLKNYLLMNKYACIDSVTRLQRVNRLSQSQCSNLPKNRKLRKISYMDLNNNNKHWYSAFIWKNTNHAS